MFAPGRMTAPVPSQVPAPIRTLLLTGH